MRLVYFEATTPELAQVRQALPDLEVVAAAEPLRPTDIPIVARDAALISVFVGSRVTAQVIAALPQLKLITTRSMGYDHIDLAACQARGIVIANVPHYGAYTVAEHAFALLLALSRKILASYERSEQHNFQRDGLEGFDLYGKTLGVVGCGRIGSHAIGIGRGFGMNIIGYDAKPDSMLTEQLGVRFVPTIEELLQHSDAVTIHVPYRPETHHLINRQNIQYCKPGMLLVNTARGAVVETHALLWALEQGILGGVGLDVLEAEEITFMPISLLAREFPAAADMVTLLRNQALLARSDVIVTPHNAFNSREARERIFTTTIRNVTSYIAGQPENVVGS